MNINLNAFLKVISLSMILMSMTLAVPLLVAIYYKESDCIRSFLIVMAISFSLGFLIKGASKPQLKTLKLWDSFFIVPIFWIFTSIIAAAPFVIQGCISNPVYAFFEAASGLSTTGSSILSEIESLPRSMLYWRSFTHWIGGMGILIFMLALLPSIGISGNALAAAEAPGPTMDKLTPKISDTAKQLYKIYTVFTAIMIAILMFLGLDFFDASTHAFGSIGTGGFSIYNDSIAHYQNSTVEITISFFMLFAAINFNLYYYALTKKGGYKTLIKDEELRFFILIVIISTLAIAINLTSSGIHEFLTALKNSFFHVTAIITTTGYATDNFNLWPSFSKIILIMLMISGGCSASTSGGLKVVRILTMFKLIKRGIHVQLHPNAIISIKMNDKKLSIDSINMIMSMIFLHFALVILSTLIICLNGYDIVSSFTAAVSCLSNVGPGLNLIGPTSNFSVFSEPVLLLLSMLMIAGRLEIYTFIMVFVPHFWKQDV